jgi:hypothetical protein
LLALALAAALAIAIDATRSPAGLSGTATHTVARRPLLPSAALAPISAALGAADPSYRIRADAGAFDARTGASYAEPGAFRAANRAQKLELTFARSGVRIDSRGAVLGLSLRAAGYGGALQAVGGATPKAVGNRALYERRGLEEWYVNGPAGLEQGFTLERALPGQRKGALTLAMALSGNVRGSVAAGGQSVVLRGPHGSSLRYDALRATDAHGHALHAWFARDGRTILLELDAAGASYPIRIDPLIAGEALPNGSETEESLFGYSVALSADGNTALVGARRASGAAWVFTRSGSSWTQQGPPLAVEEEEESTEACAKEAGECEFGRRVALSADGSTALVGGPADDSNRGAVWVFTRSGSTWTQDAKLTGGAEESTEGHFGRSLALSADGKTALVSATKGHPSRGAAWVFTRSGSTWTQQGPALTGGGEEVGVAHFGSSVALSESGDTALVGARMDDDGAGAVWVFTRTGEHWAQQGPKLTGAEESGEGRFGSSVALSAFGNTALVGGRADADGVGAAWAFTRSGSTWTQQGPKLTGLGERQEGEFGAAVALSADGEIALVGAPLDGEVGAVWLFTRSGTTWTQQGTKQSSPQATAQQFGTSVALSADGRTAVIGGPAHRHERGAAWVFANTSVPSPAVASVSPESGSSEGGTRVRITGSGFLPGTTVEIGGAASPVEVLSETELTAVTPAHAPGSEEVIVSTPDGESTGGPSYAYVVTAAPTVSSISPESGSSEGGALVTIEGSGFLSGSTTVEIGGVASSVEVLSETELTAVTPAHKPGSEPVTVSTPNGSSKGGPSYTYVLTAAPTVASVSPESGPSEGGALVTIEGSGFLSGSTTVEIGGVASPAVEVLSETELTAVTPAHAPGSEEVIVSTPNGATPAGPSYAYLPLPSVASVNPGSGPIAGGTRVTIAGSGFARGAEVDIGGAASSVEVISETEITALTPAHAPGGVEVSVSDSGGVSTGGPTYTFLAPTVTLSLSGIPQGSLGVLGSQSSQLPPPQLGVTGNLMPISGTVRVKLPGSTTFVLLSVAQQVPFGTIVDTREGKVTLTTEGPHGQPQTMSFYEGEFEITQKHSGRVFATLKGGDFALCPTKRERGHIASAQAASSSSKHAVRKLWASGHGSYSTKGNYAAGAVLGTRWLTEDLCDGTYIYVATDSVEVTNLVTHRRFRVKAGHSYFAKAP